MSTLEVTSLIMQLDPAERSEVMGALLDALDGADPSDHDQDSVTEALARRQELESGAVTEQSEAAFWASVPTVRGARC